MMHGIPLMMPCLSVKLNEVCFDCDLDLGHRNLTLVRNKPSHNVLSVKFR